MRINVICILILTCLKLLWKNEYESNYSQTVSQKLQTSWPLEEDEEDISLNEKHFFSNISAKKNIDLKLMCRKN